MRKPFGGACLVLVLLAWAALPSIGAAQDVPPEPPMPPPPKGESGDSGESKNEPAEAYENRLGDAKPDEDERIRAALDWLRDHQRADGSWRAFGCREASSREEAESTYNLEFVQPGKKEGEEGWTGTDVGITGLALLAFTGRGCTHREGDYRATVLRAVAMLRGSQSAEGRYGDAGEDLYVYNHALATMAMAEVYGLSGAKLVRSSVEKAVKFILDAQNRDEGWRYGVEPGDNDTSVTGWMILALHAAKEAGIEFATEAAYGGAVKWLDFVTAEVDGRPKTGYTSPGSSNGRLRTALDYESNFCMDGIHLAVKLFTGRADAKDKTVKALADKIVGKGSLPKWEHHKIDYYAWFWMTMGARLAGKSAWSKWSKSVIKVLKESQRGFRRQDKNQTAETLDEYGSWDAVDPWGSAGGRVYSTAICCRILETGFCYDAAGK